MTASQSLCATQWDPSTNWIVVAAFEEEKVVGAVLEDLLRRYPNVVVVNDGSHDRTGDIALAAGAIVIDHPINLGQGAALQTGIKYALSRGARFVTTFDADGQQSADDIGLMIERLIQTQSEVALGSRFMGTAQGISLQRRLLLRAAIIFQFFTSGLWLSDAHNGLRVFTSASARRLIIRQDRMAHASEIIAQIAAEHLRFVEVPCTIRYNDYTRAKGQRMSGALRILMDLAIRRLYK
jgi:polyprenyl-phospho-N-acetylgalactosaminyl synthase